MDLYFLRHGIAEDDAPTDEERQLTAEGRDKCRAAASGLAALDVAFTHVWTSPLIRARETAALVLPQQPAEVHGVLANQGPRALLAELAKLPANAVVLLVGHEPQFSETIGALLGIESPAGAIEMKKAGLAMVSADLRSWTAGSARLGFLLTPKQLRALGGES